MPVSITCPCGKRLKVADNAIGKKVRCPGCGAVNVVEPDEVDVPLAPRADVGEVTPAAAKGKRVHRQKGEWQVGDEVLAAREPDCLLVGVIKKLSQRKAFIAFSHDNWSSWVFTHSLQNVGVRPEQEVRCYEQGGSVRPGKVVHVKGDRVRVIFGYNVGRSKPIWSEDEGHFDIRSIGVLCDPTCPGAKPEHELAFYESLKKGDRVWAPWERYKLYSGTVAEVKEHQVHVHFDNGNRGWVLLGQIAPFPQIGEQVNVGAAANVYAQITDDNGKRIQIKYEKGGKEAWVAPAKLVKQGLLPVGPDAKPTRFAGGLLLKLICIPLGLLLTLLAVAVVIWNEDQAGQRAKTIAEGAAACVTVPLDKIDAAHEGKLVHVAGTADTDENVTDADFLFRISAKALKLVRTVEIYQWVERSETKKEKRGDTETSVTHYYHEAKWVKDPISSTSFHRDSGTGKTHANVGEKSIPDKIVRPKEAKVGAYRLTDAQVDRLGAGEKLMVAAETVADPPEKWHKKVRVADGAIYLSQYPDTDPTSPNVGDLRVTYTEVKPQPVTVVAMQTKDTFAPWSAPRSDNKFDEILPGVLTVTDVFKKAQEANNLVNLILRVVGGVMLAGGLYALLIHWWLWGRIFRKKKIT